MNSNYKSIVKIIGGKWKRKNISFHGSNDLRPTLNRIRETLFNWLDQDLSNRKCLDLFSGSGALGFEALSRNASSCTFIESNKSSYLKLLENKKNLNAVGAKILETDGLKFLKSNDELFDVIFCDPPFGMFDSIDLIDLASQHLTNDGLIYFESDLGVSAKDLNIYKTSKAGTVYFYLIK